MALNYEIFLSPFIHFPMSAFRPKGKSFHAFPWLRNTILLEAKAEILTSPCQHCLPTHSQGNRQSWGKLSLQNLGCAHRSLGLEHHTDFLSALPIFQHYKTLIIDASLIWLFSLESCPVPPQLRAAECSQRHSHSSVFLWVTQYQFISLNLYLCV